MFYNECKQVFRCVLVCAIRKGDWSVFCVFNDEVCRTAGVCVGLLVCSMDA